MTADLFGTVVRKDTLQRCPKNERKGVFAVNEGELNSGKRSSASRAGENWR